jgi:hypothetical protein
MPKLLISPIRKKHPSVHEVVKKERKICDSFSVCPKLYEVQPQCVTTAWLRWTMHELTGFGPIHCF